MPTHSALCIPEQTRPSGNEGVPVPEIAKKLTIKTGKNAGTSPSVASLYSAFAEAEQATAEEDPAAAAPCPSPGHRPRLHLAAKYVREAVQAYPERRHQHHPAPSRGHQPSETYAPGTESGARGRPAALPAQLAALAK